MDKKSVAPCGVICDLCYGFQRQENKKTVKCVGCNHTGNKPNHCNMCAKKLCPEKEGDETLRCSACQKFPCRKIKDLDKRYQKNYGVSIIQNLKDIEEIGMESYIKREKEKWTCKNCGELLSVHKDSCVHCGSKNIYFPN